ncbi:fumarylacetoacetate hydrolase family protein [Pelagibius marinus]|uniref:fumarylacetoacetate hydrolase family protein n=1 Tax=Pelagibius marinus TaxID=2762760 RepID=UPI00187275A3|nr:fumarylacetoacetate hydrolase family protein [Pelagibius marinus]
MHWARFRRGDHVGYGQLEGDSLKVYSGDIFDGASPTGQTVKAAEVELMTPCDPSKMICLWNNFHALAAKLEVAEPPEPLWFLKAPSAFTAGGTTIRRPGSYDGPVVYEGELGIVIGKECRGISEDQAAEHIFGYTCVNDVTAAKIIQKDPTFAQWARAKSYDGFGAFGPMIATDLDPMTLSIRTVLNGDERQNYPVADMIFPPHRLVSLLSHDMTLLPGDVIACGTSIGVGSMKQPKNEVSIVIDGIGALINTYLNE